MEGQLHILGRVVSCVQGVGWLTVGRGDVLCILELALEGVVRLLELLGTKSQLCRLTLGLVWAPWRHSTKLLGQQLQESHLCPWGWPCSSGSQDSSCIPFYLAESLE